MVSCSHNSQIFLHFARMPHHIKPRQSVNVDSPRDISPMECLPTCFLSTGSLKKATFFRSAMTPSKSDIIVGSPGGSPKLLNASICSANMFLLCTTCLPTTKVRLCATYRMILSSICHGSSSKTFAAIAALALCTRSFG